jgi:hypothetical protein
MTLHISSPSQSIDFAPKSITQPQPGKYVFDLGQNFAGVVRLKVSEAKPHDSTAIR